MMREIEQLFIGGRWIAPSSRRRAVAVDASTGLPVGSAPDGDTVDIDRAVAAARSAFDDPTGWSSWEPERRAVALESFADELAARGPDVATAVSTQNGMPITTSTTMEGQYPATIIRFYADALRRWEFEETHEHLAGGTATVVQKPHGVVAAISPWNAPQVLAAFKYAPALAAGCTVVLKPSPQVVLDAALLAEAAAASELPDGVLNIVPAGAEVGAYLVSHPGVDNVSFTGSTGAGRRIAEACAGLFRPVSLELGGKSAAIVLDDVDLGEPDLPERLYAATLLNNGQTCFIGTRILAPSSRYDEVVDYFAEFLASLPVGPAVDPGTRIGPLVSPVQRDRVEGMIAVGRSTGARLVVGGGRPDDAGGGWFVQPTLFADVDPRSELAQEEIFGPVLTVTRYEGDQEAVAIANDSRYGLGGSVWTADRDRGLAVARRVETGTIGVNRYRTDLASPFGGVKDSGLGRDMGVQAIASYLHTQSIYA